MPKLSKGWQNIMALEAEVTKPLLFFLFEKKKGQETDFARKYLHP